MVGEDLGVAGMGMLYPGGRPTMITASGQRRTVHSDYQRRWMIDRYGHIQVEATIKQALLTTAQIVLSVYRSTQAMCRWEQVTVLVHQ